MRRITHQKLDDEDDGEIGGEETHAALFACHAHDWLADEGQVDEAAVGVAEGEAEQLRHQRVLVFRRGAVVFEVFFFVFGEREGRGDHSVEANGRRRRTLISGARKCSGVFSLKAQTGKTF